MKINVLFVFKIVSRKSLKFDLRYVLLISIDLTDIHFNGSKSKHFYRKTNSAIHRCPKNRCWLFTIRVDSLSSNFMINLDSSFFILCSLEKRRSANQLCIFIKRSEHFTKRSLFSNNDRINIRNCIESQWFSLILTQLMSFSVNSNVMNVHSIATILKPNPK